MLSSIDVRAERIARWVLLTLFYAIVAATVLNLFMTRWGFRDEDPRFGFERVITYEADRPFVYRVLVPATVNALVQITPRSVRDFVESVPPTPPPSRAASGAGFLFSRTWWEHRIQLAHERYSWTHDHRLAKLYAYFLLFSTLLALCFVLRSFARQLLDADPVLLDLSPGVALMALPFSFQGGGYLYDFPDLLLISLALLLLAQKRWLLYYGVFLISLLNKETSSLLAFAPWAVFYREIPARRLWMHTAAHAALVSITIFPLRRLLAGNPGMGIEPNLQQNIWYLLEPSTYLVVDDVHAPLIALPVLYNLLALMLVAFLLLYRWKEKPPKARMLFLVYVVVLTPLYLYGGWRNEVRAFYLAAPALFVLVLHTVSEIYRRIPRGSDDSPAV